MYHAHLRFSATILVNRYGGSGGCGVALEALEVAVNEAAATLVEAHKSNIAANRRMCCGMIG